MNVPLGLIRPGMAPLGQGHQPPLSYISNAFLLSLFLYPQEVGSFVDYQAGLTYASDSLGFGGFEDCAYRIDPSRMGFETTHFRNSIKYLRVFGAFLFAASVLCSYFVGRLFLPQELALATTLLHAAVPTAIWRSALVNNDNMVAALGALAFALGAYFIKEESRRPFPLLLFAGVLAALAFISKYTGVAAFGMVLLALLLKPKYSWWKKLILLIGVSAIFTAIVYPDLSENLAVDKDILSRNVLLRVAAPLHAPSSFLKIASDPDFIPTVVSRYWLNFHNTGHLDKRFPLWVVHLWWAVLLVCTLGLVLSTIRRNSPLLLRHLLYSILTICGSLAVIIFVGKTFPLPAGRYIHYSLPAASLLIVSGIYGLSIQFFSKKNSIRVTTASVFALWILGNGVTTGYAWFRYGDCKAETQHTVESGVASLSADITGDGRDELVYFHRIRNRVFIAEHSRAGFKIRPRWTRSVGLVADEVHHGDFDQDGKDDIVFWRSGSGDLYVAYGRSFLEHNKSISPFIDLSAEHDHLEFSKHQDDRLFILDSDACFYNSSMGTWHCYHLQKTPSGLAIQKQRVYQGAPSGEPLVLRTPAEFYLATAGLQSLEAQGASSGKTISISLESTKKSRLVAVDIDGNRYDELVSRVEGDTCFEWIHPFIDEAGAQVPLSDQNPLQGATVFKERYTVCLDRLVDFFWDYRNIYRIGRPGGDALASFDKRVGITEISFFQIVEPDFHRKLSLELSESIVFDAGFYSAQQRSALFGTWEKAGKRK